LKCIIVYTSQTGNTEKAARAIQQGIKATAGHCDIVKTREANWRRLPEYDLIGLGCPVYGFCETQDMQAFIKKLHFVGGKHAFPFATHGTVGEYFAPSIIPKMKRKGLIVIGYWDCYADVHMGGIHGVWPTAGHPDYIDLKEAEAFGREIVDRSRRISAGETGLIPPVPKPPLPGGVNEYIRKRQIREVELGMPEMVAKRPAPRWVYNRAKCRYPKCRLCMENCPTEGIDLTVQPPVIAKPCIGCGMCELICPTGALSREGFGAGIDIPEAVRKAMFKEFYLDPLAQAEAEGRFRRLVEPPDIQPGPPPGDRDKHPRWIIGKGFV
jgi:flavodoxin/ferredoxin